MKKFLVFFAAILCAVSCVFSNALGDDNEDTPNPVEIGIDNVLQQTPVWCWVAVTEQLVTFSQGGSPRQCALVAAANGVPSAFCCTGYNSACVRAGTMDQLRVLLLAFGQHASDVIPAPRDPMKLYEHLQNGHPVVLQVRTGMNTTHVVVLKGMFFRRVRDKLIAYLVVNDPMSVYLNPIEYSRAYPAIVNALVVR